MKQSLVVVAACLLLAACIDDLPTCKEPQLVPGMHEAEIVALCGQPREAFYYSNTKHYQYVYGSLTGDWVNIYFDDDKKYIWWQSHSLEQPLRRSDTQHEYLGWQEYKR